MSKMKTKKIATKRFRITKNGKVMHRVQGARHIRRTKSKSRQRRQDRPAEITTTRFARVIRNFFSH
ncbi:50S ribosomal protein L35 [Candidatus Gottesmanbacteria bacterium]|nr:50S ribosomal protein L35 [Candidatus Gottesmanbacteria bacterium]